VERGPRPYFPEGAAVKVRGARPFMGFLYELSRAVVRWLNPPCVHCAELGYNCFVCAERAAASRRQGEGQEG
jgi:hypothetical protein